MGTFIGAVPFSSSSSFLISQNVSSVLGAQFHNTREWIHILYGSLFNSSAPWAKAGDFRGSLVWFLVIPPSLVNISRYGA